MPQIITSTGTLHIVETETEDWRADRSVCGHEGTGRGATPISVAQHVDELCEKCRKNASSETMMMIYELADESENGSK